MRLSLTGTNSGAPSELPTRVMLYSPASPCLRAPQSWQALYSTPLPIPAGAFGPWPRAKLSITRCPITMARFGHMTTLWWDRGLGRYGRQGLAARLLTGLFEVALHLDLRRLPELFCGFHRRPDGTGPTVSGGLRAPGLVGRRAVPVTCVMSGPSD